MAGFPGWPQRTTQIPFIPQSRNLILGYGISVGISEMGMWRIKVDYMANAARGSWIQNGTGGARKKLTKFHRGNLSVSVSVAYSFPRVPFGRYFPLYFLVCGPLRAFGARKNAYAMETETLK